MNAIALNSMQFNLSRILGPMLADSRSAPRGRRRAFS